MCIFFILVLFFYYVLNNVRRGYRRTTVQTDLEGKGQGAMV